MDVDFLIPNPNQIKNEIDIPTLLKERGFVPTFNRSSGIVKYDHPELRLEFLVPEMGRGNDGPQEIRKLHIKAQGLRYLNLLTAYPKKWVKAILSVSEKHFPRLNETAKAL